MLKTHFILCKLHPNKVDINKKYWLSWSSYTVFSPKIFFPFGLPQQTPQITGVGKTVVWHRTNKLQFSAEHVSSSVEWVDYTIRWLHSFIHSFINEQVLKPTMGQAWHQVLDTQSWETVFCPKESQPGRRERLTTTWSWCNSCICRVAESL